MEASERDNDWECKSIDQEDRGEGGNIEKGSNMEQAISPPICLPYLLLEAHAIRVLSKSVIPEQVL